MFFPRLADRQPYQKKPEEHGREATKPKLKVGHPKDLPKQGFISRGVEEPGNPLDDQHHSQYRHKKSHLILP